MNSDAVGSTHVVICNNFNTQTNMFPAFYSDSKDTDYAHNMDLHIYFKTGNYDEPTVLPVLLLNGGFDWAEAILIYLNFIYITIL